MIEAEVFRKQVSREAEANTPIIMAFLHEHQPCTIAFIAEALGMELARVSATIGTHVRANRLRFTLEKIKGQPRKVKFYSEVI